MQNIQQAEEDQILTSTKTILYRDIQLNEEDHTEYNEAFKPIPNTTAGEIKMTNKQGVELQLGQTKPRRNPKLISSTFLHSLQNTKTTKQTLIKTFKRISAS